MLFFFIHKRRDNALPGWNARSFGYVPCTPSPRGDNAGHAVSVTVEPVRIARVGAQPGLGRRLVGEARAVPVGRRGRVRQRGHEQARQRGEQYGTKHMASREQESKRPWPVGALAAELERPASAPDGYGSDANARRSAKMQLTRETGTPTIIDVRRRPR